MTACGGRRLWEKGQIWLWCLPGDLEQPRPPGVPPGMAKLRLVKKARSAPRLDGSWPGLRFNGHGPLSTEPARDIERALVTCRQLLSDTRTIFETLSGQEGINKIILSLRDINR
jgi:hypothetical protein